MVLILHSIRTLLLSVYILKQIGYVFHFYWLCYWTILYTLHNVLWYILPSLISYSSHHVLTSLSLPGSWPLVLFCDLFGFTRTAWDHWIGTTHWSLMWSPVGTHWRQWFPFILIYCYKVAHQWWRGRTPESPPSMHIWLLTGPFLCRPGAGIWNLKLLLGLVFSGCVLLWRHFVALLPVFVYSFQSFSSVFSEPKRGCYKRLI